MFSVLDTSLICILTISHTGAVRIQECRDGFVDLHEDVTNDVTCNGFDDTDTMTWTITRNGIPQDVATCAPRSGCTNHSSDVGAVRMAGGTNSQLVFQPPGRAEDQYTAVACISSKSQQGQRSAWCELNVISMLYCHLELSCSR